MTRPIFTIAYEEYDAYVYRTLVGVCREAVDMGLCLDNDCDDPKACTVSEVRKALKLENIMRLYPLDGGDWTYRIEKHEGYVDRSSRNVRSGKDTGGRR